MSGSDTNLQDRSECGHPAKQLLVGFGTPTLMGMLKFRIPEKSNVLVHLAALVGD